MNANKRAALNRLKRNQRNPSARKVIGSLIDANDGSHFKRSSSGAWRPSAAKFAKIPAVRNNKTFSVRYNGKAMKLAKRGGVWKWVPASEMNEKSGMGVINRAMAWIAN